MATETYAAYCSARALEEHRLGKAAGNSRISDSHAKAAARYETIAATFEEAAGTPSLDDETSD